MAARMRPRHGNAPGTRARSARMARAARSGSAPHMRGADRHPEHRTGGGAEAHARAPPSHGGTRPDAPAGGARRGDGLRPGDRRCRSGVAAGSRALGARRKRTARGGRRVDHRRPRERGATTRGRDALGRARRGRGGGRGDALAGARRDRRQGGALGAGHRRAQPPRVDAHNARPHHRPPGDAGVGRRPGTRRGRRPGAGAGRLPQECRRRAARAGRTGGEAAQAAVARGPRADAQRAAARERTVPADHARARRRAPARARHRARRDADGRSTAPGPDGLRGEARGADLERRLVAPGRGRDDQLAGARRNGHDTGQRRHHHAQRRSARDDGRTVPEGAARARSGSRSSTRPGAPRSCAAPSQARCTESRCPTGCGARSGRPGRTRSPPRCTPRTDAGTSRSSARSPTSRARSRCGRHPERRRSAARRGSQSGPPPHRRRRRRRSSRRGAKTPTPAGTKGPGHGSKGAEKRRSQPGTPSYALHCWRLRRSADKWWTSVRSCNDQRRR